MPRRCPLLATTTLSAGYTSPPGVPEGDLSAAIRLVNPGPVQSTAGRQLWLGPFGRLRWFN